MWKLDFVDDFGRFGHRADKWGEFLVFWMKFPAVRREDAAVRAHESGSGRLKTFGNGFGNRRVKWWSAAWESETVQYLSCNDGRMNGGDDSQTAIAVPTF